MVALRSFIDAFDAEGLQQVKPLIPQLLDVFFQLMQEVGAPPASVPHCCSSLQHHWQAACVCFSVLGEACMLQV